VLLKAARSDAVLAAWFHRELDDIINTNAFTLIKDGSIHSYVFPGISRFNHSCAPSAMMIFDDESETAVVRATENVPCGREVLINYGAMGDLQTRQHFLHTCFKFDCNCERCTAEQQTRTSGRGRDSRR
tara:strand:- start:231 stop:617 length:387 start_codon:yes stop_codon:yes gene_type:complete